MVLWSFVIFINSWHIATINHNSVLASVMVLWNNHNTDVAAQNTDPDFGSVIGLWIILFKYCEHWTTIHTLWWFCQELQKIYYSTANTSRPSYLSFDSGLALSKTLWIINTQILLLHHDSVLASMISLWIITAQVLQHEKLCLP